MLYEVITVMTNSVRYFTITVMSYPFLALSGAYAALFRAQGNSGYPMKISFLSNILNIIGNAVFIFGMDLGVTGAAISTLISRVFCMLILFYSLRKSSQQIRLRNYMKLRPDLMMITTILAIAIPSAIENGMFQFGKLAIQSTVSTMGTKVV